MIIKNGFVYTDQHEFKKTNLHIENHTIVEIGDSINPSQSELTSEIIDATNLYVIPGLIDIHTHGAFGHDFCDNSRDGLIEIAKYLKQNGITSFCPTSMTLSADELSAIFQTATASLPDNCSNVVGINMEGPFIASSKKGAQNGTYIQSPDISLFRELNSSAKHLIKLITIAPELDNAIKFIQEISGEVTVSLGHTDADYETTKQALNAGANHITHLYNAMPPYHHRNPGVIGAAADDSNTMVELICDGIHIHPSVIRNTFRLFGKNRVILISDSMMATGMPDGTYELGRQTVYMKNKHALLKDGTLAGSASNLFDCVKNAVSFGIPLEAAIQAATENPARSIGIFDQVGSLSTGKRADVILMNKNLEILHIL